MLTRNAIVMMTTLPLAACIAGAQVLQDQSSAATLAAETGCRAAVAAASGRAMADTSARRVQLTDAGTRVTVGVAGRPAVWSCLADAQGNVRGLARPG